MVETFLAAHAELEGDRGRRRVVRNGRAPGLMPARANRRASSASSVSSPGSGQTSPAAAARFGLSWIVLRATPSGTVRISVRSAWVDHVFGAKAIGTRSASRPLERAHSPPPRHMKREESNGRVNSRAVPWSTVRRDTALCLFEVTG